MCGIAGVITRERRAEANALVGKVLESQHRRGPDHRATEVIAEQWGSVVLGHNRLSIIDLSSAAHQPMWDVTRQYLIVFNGEIYNYKELRQELSALGYQFTTQSDTEVIMASYRHWGTEAFSRFNGMFAFAIYDTAKKRCMLVRDRFGVKPLYYTFKDEMLCFASTPGVMAEELGCAPDLEYISKGLRYWVYEDDLGSSQYEGIRSLLPGHYLEVPLQQGPLCDVAPVPYYSLRDRLPNLIDELASAPHDRLCEAVDERLYDAVQLRLRSDVPVGVSLSGGLDSSLIMGIVSRQHDNALGFSFGHPDVNYSEGPLVAKVQRLTGVGVKYIWPDQDSVTRAFWDTLAAQDSPFPTTSIVAQYLVFQAARSAGVKVLLGGQGGDEAFLGYRKFQVFYLRQLIRNREWADAAVYAGCLLPTALAELPKASLYWGARKRYTGTSGVDSALCLPHRDHLGLGMHPGETLRERQITDLMRYSLPTLLRYEDRNSMANSVESRLPFMDYRVVELGTALPEALKLRNGYGKWVVRKIARGLVPEEIRTARSKRGFDVNQSQWIRGGLGNSIRTGLHERHQRIRSFMREGVDINQAFSDERLEGYGGALAEAITLLWLGDRTR